MPAWERFPRDHGVILLASTRGDRGPRALSSSGQIPHPGHVGWVKRRPTGRGERGAQRAADGNLRGHCRRRDPPAPARGLPRAVADRRRPRRPAGGRRPRQPARRAADGPGDLGRAERRTARERLALRLHPLHRHALQRTRPQTPHPCRRTGPRLGLDVRHAAAGRRPGPGRRPSAAPAGRPPYRPAGRSRRHRPAHAVPAGPQHPVARPDQHHPGPARPAGLLRRPRPAHQRPAHRGRRRAPAHAAALHPAAVVHRPQTRLPRQRRHLRRLHRARLGRDAPRLPHLLGAPPGRRRPRRPGRRPRQPVPARRSAAARPERPPRGRGLPDARRGRRRPGPAPRRALLRRRPAAPRRRDHRLRRDRHLAHRLAAPTAVGAARGRRPGRQTRLRPIRVAGRRDPGHDPAGQDAAARHGVAGPAARQPRPAGRRRRRHGRAVPLPHFAVLPVTAAGRVRADRPGPVPARAPAAVPAPGAHPPQSPP